MNNKQLIWIGAGTATTPEFNFNDYAFVTLVEARKDACLELSAQFPNSEKVAIKQCCVSSTGKEKDFFTFNVEEFSALSRPAELKTLYPGLKVDASSELETLSIDELIEQEAREPDLELFIDTPATAGELVRKLIETGTLEKISKLYVTAGSDLLYEGSLSMSFIQELLNGHFITEVSRDESDPDIPTVTFALNKNAKALEQLKAENDKLKEQLQAARQQEQKTEEIVQDRDNKANLLVKKEQALEAKINELKVCQGKLEELVSETSKKEAELKAVRESNESEMARLKDEITALSKKVNETGSVNVNLSKSIDITTKQNMKLQVDLDDLRERFANSKESEARLKALISDLHEKLQKAANFYHRLEKTNPELLSQSDE